MTEATTWVTRSCARLDLVVTSPGERTHNQPWSYAVAYDIREADGAQGRVWLKANRIGTRHEPGLICALGTLVPDLVPEVLAIDADRAWSLTRDAGPTWRSALPVEDHWPLWEDLLRRYAAAQLSLAAHRTALLATGAPERSPATLPTQAASLVAELALTGASSGGLSVSQAQALEARLPSYGQWCRELDDCGLPTTIQHDDLHSNNICWPGSARDRLAGPGAGSRVIDWGDASIGHPFGTMLTALRSMAHHGRCDVDDARVLRVRDAYLEAFNTYASIDRLVDVLNQAVRVGAVTRALSWRSALTASPTSVQRDLDFPVRGWLLDLLRP